MVAQLAVALLLVLVSIWVGVVHGVSLTWRTFLVLGLAYAIVHTAVFGALDARDRADGRTLDATAPSDRGTISAMRESWRRGHPERTTSSGLRP